MRRCVRCRASAPKAELVRVARDPHGTWHLDPDARAGGRGAWLCPDCAARANERDLKRAFRGQAADVADQLRGLAHERPVREG